MVRYSSDGEAENVRRAAAIRYGHSAIRLHSGRRRRISFWYKATDPESSPQLLEPMMKRRLVSLLSLFFLFAWSASAQQPASMRVNADRVNMRKGPSVDSGIVRSLTKGTVVSVVSHDGNWVNVQLPGQTTTGWVRSDLLDAVPAASSSMAPATMPPPAPSSMQTNAVAPPPPPPTPPTRTTTPTKTIAPPPAPKPSKPPAPPKSTSGGKNDSYHGGFTLFGGITSFSADVTPSLPAGTTLGNASGFEAGLGIIAHLGGPIGLELDGAYVQGGFTSTTAGTTTTQHDNNAGGALLLRPAFGSGPVRFFVLGGANVGYLIDCTESVTGVTPAPACKPGANRNRTDYGAVIGGGLSFGPLAVQVRYHIGMANLDKTAGATVKSKGIAVLASLIL
jgi:Bacterial SH3 domain